MNIAELLPELLKGILHFTWGNAVMITAALVLIYLAIYKEIEPVLVTANRVWLPACQHSTGWYDRCRGHDGRALQRRYRD